MSESRTTVACGNCGRQLDENSDIPAEQRQPCPVCGSTSRSFNVLISATLALASAIGLAPETHVGKVQADETLAAAAIRGRYRATLEWYKLEGDFWLVHVVNEHGDVVDGGVGDDPEGALLEVYERLIPPE